MTSTAEAPRATALPADSLIAGLYVGADLADAFVIALPAECTQDMRVLANALLAQPAPWVTALMRLRDGIVAPFGLKTSRHLRTKPGGERIGIFKVYTVTDTELVCGEDDTHLDFRASVLRRPAADGGGEELVTSTVVHCHNRLGRFYIAVIAPFHRAVVRSNIRSAAQRGWPGL